MATMELAVSLVRPASLARIGTTRSARGAYWQALHRDPGLASWLSDFAPTHLYLGSEFCEQLLPSVHTLKAGLCRAQESGLKCVLLTPIASPQCIRSLADLLPLLPDGAEIIVNDWGVAYFIREHFPALRAIAGRILCRMIKDPRLRGGDWAPQCGLGVESARFQALLKRLGFSHVEMDVPIFAESGVFSGLPMRKSVHLPFSYIAKGRMCRPGSLAAVGPERFAVGRRCRKECLGLSAKIDRPGIADRLDSYQVGNTLFARHSPEMRDVVTCAVDNGHIDRLVVPGDAP